VRLGRFKLCNASSISGFPLAVAIAGSVGPYGACLHDGSEYTGSYLDDFGVTDKFLGDWHRPRIEALLLAGADYLAIETMPGIREVRVRLLSYRCFLVLGQRQSHRP
jgi:S-methylmethionine-dependent homocysteine/selenocysteine methylase